jgi:phage terminase small subunit
LTSQQKQFADEYLVDLNATQAAIRAHYSPQSARSQASQLLDNEEIQKYISERQQKVSDKLNYSLERVLSNFATVFDRCMQGEPVLDFDGNPTGEWKFDAGNANRANENIGKHLGFFKEDNEQLKVVPVSPTINVYNTAPPLAKTEKDVDV